MHRSLLVVVVSLVSFAAAAAQEADPPVRVGRVASVSGTVSFHLAGAEQWERASLNLPLTDGSALWTQPGAAATIGVSGNRVALDGATELDIDKLDEHTLVVTQPQGDSYWRFVTLPSEDSVTVQTPRGSVAFAVAGRYEVISGDTDHPTEITVVEGSARVTGLAADVVIGPNQTLTITGDGAATPLVPTLRATVRDAFVQRMLSAERTPVHRVALPPAVALMTGSEILAEEGNWGETPDYGPVWYPPVAVGFVPYRDGHWAYVAPWGWTWVDNAPWGFAPTHYGRWAEIGDRWGWVPGREWAPERPPIYAPALVAFIAGAALGSSVGWVALGPHDAYRPAYQVNPRNAETFNRPTGATVNLTVINRQAVTVVPTQVMVNSGNVAQAFRAGPPLPATVMPQAIQFRAPVTPSHATLGATSAVLREVAPRELEGRPRPEAPGPALAPAVASPGRIGAALLGATVAGGGAAAALLRPSEPRSGLPTLRSHGVTPSALPPAAAPPGPAVPLAPKPPVMPLPQVVTPETPQREPIRRPAVEPPASRPAGPPLPQVITPETAQRQPIQRPPAGPLPRVAAPETVQREPVQRPNVIERPQLAEPRVRPQPERALRAEPEHVVMPRVQTPEPHASQVAARPPPPPRPEPRPAAAPRGREEDPRRP